MKDLGFFVIHIPVPARPQPGGHSNNCGSSTWWKQCRIQKLDKWMGGTSSASPPKDVLLIKLAFK